MATKELTQESGAFKNRDDFLRDMEHGFPSFSQA